MAERAAQATAFLERAGWGAARRAHLAGDASNRRYERLRQDGARAVLMDAPPARGEDVRPFARIARHLRGLGLSAPAILAEEAGAGFLLIEDLGDDLYARLLDAEPAREAELYVAATELLAHLHAAPPPRAITDYDPPLMGDLAALALDWYAPAEATAPGRTEFADLVTGMCAALAPGAGVLVLRDYHAENLLWLPERRGLARVGLLDFQDAMAGHPAYDLVSLLQDARRDVPEATEQAMRAHYVAITGQDGAAFSAAYAALGAQRALRILGVFARLCLRDGKPRYLDYLPRVWDHLQRNLAHPELAPLRRRIAAHLPAPDTQLREELRRRCPTPTP